MENYKGLFIVFEGPDGAGKTTLAKWLTDHLSKDEDREVVVFREPGSTFLAETLRPLLKDDTLRLDPKTELLLFEACRREFVVNRLKPALQAGKTVICDRYIFSTIAYQGAGRGLEQPIISRLNKYVVENTYPDFVFYLDVPPEVGQQRSTDVDGKYEKTSLEERTRVREAYLDLANTGSNSYLIDATQSIEEVFAEIICILEGVLKV